MKKHLIKHTLPDRVRNDLLLFCCGKHSRDSDRGTDDRAEVDCKTCRNTKTFREE